MTSGMVGILCKYHTSDKACVVFATLVTRGHVDARLVSNPCFLSFWYIVALLWSYILFKCSVWYA